MKGGVYRSIGFMLFKALYLICFVEVVGHFDSMEQKLLERTSKRRFVFGRYSSVRLVMCTQQENKQKRSYVPCTVRTGAVLTTL